MRPRRGASGLSGILLVDKPAGMTSHDVVSRVRRLSGEGRVGHAGTLDPMATGLLCVLLGPATRLAPFLTARDKTYRARIAFGTATDTDDSEGTVVRTADVDESLFESAFAQTLLARFVGPMDQMPPAYSALKVDGRPAHRVARAGGTVTLAPRAITVHEARLEGLDPAARTWDVAFRVSKGTYVRALARDIGERAGSAAHLAALRRTASGDLDVADARTLEEIERAAGSGGIARLLADPVLALGLPVLHADATAIAAGVALPEALAGDTEAERFAIVDEDSLLAVYRRSGARLRPEVVLSVPAERRGS